MQADFAGAGWQGWGAPALTCELATFHSLRSPTVTLAPAAVQPHSPFSHPHLGHPQLQLADAASPALAFTVDVEKTGPGWRLEEGKKAVLVGFSRCLIRQCGEKFRHAA